MEPVNRREEHSHTVNTAQRNVKGNTNVYNMNTHATNTQY